MSKFFKKNYYFFLILILIIGFILRLYRLDNPIADWHSWRQADTSAVSRNFVEHGFDLLHPRMNNVSNVQSGLYNPNAYFFAEFPIYDAAQASLYVLFGGLTIEEWGRLLTDIISIIAALFIFLIVKKHSNKTTALFSAGFYAFLPYNIYYGRVILPDPSMVMAILAGIYFFDCWLDTKFKEKKYYLFFFLTVLFTALAFLLKPVAAFFVLPMLYLSWKRYRWKFILRIDLWIYFILSIAPLLWWRWWVSHYPEGIPAYLWLFNSNNIRFHPAFFRWIFYERITKLISGYVGVIFLIFGVSGIWKDKKERLFFLSFISSSLIYLFTIATGNVQHDYYQIAIMPTVAICMSFGAVWLIDVISKHTSRSIAYGMVGIGILLSFFFSWMQVRDYFNINNWSIVAAGKAVAQLTPKDAMIVANYNGDSSLLYQTDRQGWASFSRPIPRLIYRGADYMVLVNPTAQDMVFAQQYKVIAYTKQYVIFDLHQKP